MIEEHRDRVWHYILSRGVPASDAEDIFQEIWLAFWQKQDHPNPIGLLYRIASNKIADYWRRNPPLSEDIDPDTSAQEIQDLDSIQRKLYHLTSGAGLTDDHSQLLTLHHVVGYTTRECAVILEEKEETLRSRLKRCRKLIREFFTRDQGDSP